MTSRPTKPLVVHASAVAMFGRGALFLGGSGSGKSRLALEMMAWGGTLIADDRTCLHRDGPDLIASCPRSIAGRIEARHIGILRADPAPPTPVALVIDLDRHEPKRLPEPRFWETLDWSGPLIHGRDLAGLAAGLVQYLRAGMAGDP